MTGTWGQVLAWCSSERQNEHVEDERLFNFVEDKPRIVISLCTGLLLLVILIIRFSVIIYSKKYQKKCGDCDNPHTTDTLRALVHSDYDLGYYDTLRRSANVHV